MLSQSGTAFDIPENRPPDSSTFYQDVRRYDCQKRIVLPGKSRFATGMSSGYGDSSYFAGPNQPQKDFTEQLRALHQYYTILDDDRTVIGLLETEPALYSLLIEAVEPLRHAFGDKRLIYVRVQSADEDSILKVTVRLPAHFGDNPEGALQAFDEDWWLHNCHRSSGALVFDYEM